MPLDKSGTKEAFSRNVSAEMHAGKPQRQALAIAYSVKRQKRAVGGFTKVGAATAGPGAFNVQPKQMVRNEMRTLTHQGPIKGIVGGRTDHLPLSVKSSSYILPADHVSSLGQGNTANGHAVLSHMFGPSGPYGASAMKIAHGRGAPKLTGHRASGGAADGESPAVDIMAASGEYTVPPEYVAAIGNGDVNRGHAILDSWVLENRKRHIKTLRGLPAPATK